MYFLVDNKNKIIFGFSGKCGSTHIKNIFWFLQTNDINVTYDRFINNPLPNDIKDYITIMIIRNPYKRIISGFLDKYRQNGEFINKWNHDNITFSMFVNELEKNNWDVLSKMHFLPQTLEGFDMKVLNSKILKIYDINNIDYKYIEELYNQKIPEIILHKKKGHEREKFEKNFDNYVYDLNMDEYYSYNIDIKYFYNEEIKNKILKYYNDDFTFFLNYGFDYINTIF